MSTPSTDANREDRVCWGPRRMFSIGPYTFSRYRREHLHHHSRKRWECAAHGRGSGPTHTPLGAFLALRRWLKEPARPV